MSLNEFAKKHIIPFMQEHDLVLGTVKTVTGDKVEVKRDKHGFYSIKVIEIEEGRPQ